jgi:hypothetical protein
MTWTFQVIGKRSSWTAPIIAYSCRKYFVVTGERSVVPDIQLRINASLLSPCWLWSRAAEFLDYSGWDPWPVQQRLSDTVSDKFINVT